MKIYTKKQFLEKFKEENFIEKLKNSVFIYPTDTVYGIGCDATNNKLIQKIRKIKQRDKKPFSIIAPSKKWIYENCAIDTKVEKYLEKLPGAYTLILKLKNKKAINKETNNNMDTIGVRIPKHWFSKIVKKINIPIITTSVNISGQKNMTNINDLNQEIKKQVDFIVYEGEKKGKSSKVIDCITEKIIRK